MTFRRPLQALLIALSLALAGGAFAAPAAGDMAPDDLGKTIRGEEIKVSGHRGKVVVVSFWATWCGYCLKELPVLESIQRVYGAERVKVVAVNTEGRDTFRDAARKLRSVNMTLAYDPGGKNEKAYGVNGIPHLVIIGRDGVIVQVYRGYGESSLDGIVADINSAIGGPGAAAAAPAGAAAQ